ncbi:pilus assembly FimT family protein [Inmirania thermothiophila]|uniref:Type II secretion system protein H n=1 Tax=Inmirania thermothiophila TaxID=1750597 RepID=A0A3N1Y6R2_9GAMM|nr:GspH/FimT family pseudopilin [Inmirania thermothiophila]ROR34198.1 MSHA pilin protein MshC [Inmirania thermothiophila]
MRRAGGFTLTEAVIVLVLVGVLAVFAAPRLMDTRAARERGFFDELLSAIRYAQVLAVGSGCPVRVTIEAAGYRVERHQTGCTAGPWITVAHPSRAGGLERGGAPAPLALDGAAPASLVFTPLGEVEDGKDHTVTLGGRSIQVWGGSGYAEAS